MESSVFDGWLAAVAAARSALFAQHGRVKVRTSEEQQELKRKQRAEKLKKFQQLRGAIFAKRAAQEHTAEALALTRLMLSEAPDIATFWNYRRDILLALFGGCDAAAKQALLVDELAFLDECLMRSPKSYGIWHQVAIMFIHVWAVIRPAVLNTSSSLLPIMFRAQLTFLR